MSNDFFFSSETSATESPRTDSSFQETLSLIMTTAAAAAAQVGRAISLLLQPSPHTPSKLLFFLQSNV
jgi:hypothetical protein